MARLMANNSNFVCFGQLIQFQWKGEYQWGILQCVCMSCISPPIAQKGVPQSDLTRVACHIGHASPSLGAHYAILRTPVRLVYRRSSEARVNYDNSSSIHRNVAICRQDAET